ncbi:hypothetical protein [Sphingobacterium spiritivorum]|uniref:hypothetical protein n=1 Tax=Sphingobacterium spiritivorum TaxID=258 RepID=UPI003DA414B4
MAIICLIKEVTRYSSFAVRLLSDGILYISASDIIIHYQSIINMNTPSENPNSTHKELIIQAIRSSMDSLYIYCFSYIIRSQQASTPVISRHERIELHHYYLFVVTESHKEEFLQKPAEVNSRLPEHIRVTLVCESLDELEEESNYNNSFYQHILVSSEKWVTDNKHPVDITPYEIRQLVLHKTDEQIWKIRYNNAKGLLASASQGCGCGYDEAIAVMLSLALEQICLGMILILLKYYPPAKDLVYLFDLISCITPIAEEIFCLSIPEERKIIENLSDSLRQFRSISSYEVDGYNLYLVCDRTEIFLQKADQFVLTYLESLE